MSPRVTGKNKVKREPVQSPFDGGRRARIKFRGRSVDRRSGNSGSVVVVTAGERYPKSYTLRTHGKTPQQVADQIREIEEHQRVKELKIDEMRSAYGQQFTVGGARYKVTDAVVTERGNNAELIIHLARSLGGGRWRQRALVIRRVFRTVNDVPNAQGAVTIARAIAEQSINAEVEQAQFAADVQAILEVED